MSRTLFIASDISSQRLEAPPLGRKCATQTGPPRPRKRSVRLKAGVEIKAIGLSQEQQTGHQAGCWCDSFVSTCDHSFNDRFLESATPLQLPHCGHDGANLLRTGSQNAINNGCSYLECSFNLWRLLLKR
jgi:hypothetical protein